MVLVAGVAVVASACGKSKKPDDGGPPGPGEQVVTTPPEVFGSSTFNPQLQIVDPAGKPIGNAMVVFGNASVRSKEDGSALLPEQGTDKTVVVTVSADGYAPNTKTLSMSNAYTPLLVELRKVLDFAVEAEAGGSIDVGAAAVALPGRSFLLPNGTSYSGMVTVKATTLYDPVLGTNDLTAGDWAGPGPKGPVPLDIFGAIHVDVQTPTGERLTFAAGERPVVSFLLPSGSTQAMGDTLPLYTLDEKAGLWNESGSCTVQQAAQPVGDRTSTCVGSVEHFSSIAAGFRRMLYPACARFILKLTKAVPGPDKFLGWQIVPMAGFFVGGYLDKATNEAPQGTVQIAWALPAAPSTLPVRLAVQTGPDRLQMKQLAFPFDAVLSMDGSCRDIVIYYDPPSGTFALNMPGTPRPSPVDSDGDGYFAKGSDMARPGDDCDDNDKAINPGARAVYCSGKDHNCDGKPDRDAFGATMASFPDDIWNYLCPQTREVCPSEMLTEMPGNTRDENCDGFASDADGDTYFRRGDPLLASSGKAPDCNDYATTAHPGGTEVTGNVIDEDCNGVADDQDKDGYPSVKQVALSMMSLNTTEVDCNDLDKQAHPGSTFADLPVIAQFYDGNRRKAEFCGLFDAMGRPNAKLLNLFYVADKNCNGVLEDLDGDGKKVAAAGMYPNVPPYDANDLDPRIQTKDQTPATNDSVCTPDLNSFGAGPREVCPRLFNREQICVETYDQDLRPTGEFACGAPDWDGFAIPPTPYGFGNQYGPCSTMVLPMCGSQLLCGGPVKFADWYTQALKNRSPAYDISAESFTGFCMPGCDEVK
jgi:hypothetical protein